MPLQMATELLFDLICPSTSNFFQPVIREGQGCVSTLLVPGGMFEMGSGEKLIFGSLREV